MCVKQTETACIPDADMDMETFRALEPAFPHLDGLLLNGIGEPLLTPELADMIRLARQSMPEAASIGFQTNGMLLTRQRADELVEAGLNMVCLSVDMVDEDGILHGGEDVSLSVNALQYLRDASAKYGKPVRLGVEFVLMRDNAEGLPRSLDWAADQGAEFALVTHMLPYSENISDQELFNPNTEKSMAEFLTWRKEAEKRGIDLNQYFGLPWKFTKTKDQAELTDFVKERIQDALRRDIPIHFANLLEWTTPERLAEQEWLSGIFAEARRVAGGKKMDLTLPPLSAVHDRHCEFVEQGVAHITPSGDVRPCYFLWHEYSCYMDGGMKHIQPRTMGNVLESSILEIWESEEYRAFRGEVLDYDYPYCSNCSVVPCSDVTGDGRPFERDCYGLSIPCGHCIWCMGGVRCLL